MTDDNRSKNSKNSNTTEERIEKASEVAENVIGVAGSTATVIAAMGEAAPIIVPFTKFVPLISEIGNLLNEVIEITQAAEHNKRTCDSLLQRVNTADLAVHELKLRKNQEFFNNKNYLCLQNLVTIITQIKKFTADVSQMKTLLKYIQAKSIKKTFKELTKEFDSCIHLLTFITTIKNTINAEEEAEQLKSDQEELNKYLEEMGADVRQLKDGLKEMGADIKEGINELSKEFSSTVLKVNAMNSTMEKFMNEKSTGQQKIDNIFQVHPLRMPDYEETSEAPRKNGRVTKWVDIRNKGHEFAFKNISAEDQKFVQNQVTILKELHDWQNIIKFYGLTSDGNKWYLVTEWAEFGNLREFYKTSKEIFDLRLKLRISLDIARGLNFLRTVEIVHRDIRAENILITLNETAKLANFKLSRHLNEATLNQGQNLERVRYCAPELLERAPNYKYDHRCEVYSFGILLWEISEENIPYQDSNDILEITDRVRNKMYRESFSENSPMPENFRNLAKNAVNHDPEFRPKIAMMFSILRDCYSEVYRKPSSLISINSQGHNNKPPKPPTPKRQFSIDQDEYAIPANLPDFESFKYMTLAEAAKQHKLVDKSGRPIGDTKTAYKCFEAYANLTQSNTNSNQIKAKYYKAYYISRGLDDSDHISSGEKDSIVASLFKEVADDKSNEFPEAKLRYGDCLYNGKGVEQNLPRALEYFEKAAENGFKVAMYNAGNLYYNGGGGVKDKDKAIYYMKLAAYNNYDPAIKFCKDRDIAL